MSAHQPIAQAHRSAAVPRVRPAIPSDGSALVLTVRSIVLVILAVFVVIVLLPALLAAAGPGTLAGV